MIRVGILGTGFGRTHAEIYKGLEGVEIVGIYGRNIKKLEEIKESLAIKTTNDIDELIEDPSIDLIDICLPTHLHKKYVVKALNNKKHVFCETPVAYTLAEAEEMKKSSKENNRELYVDLFYKFSDPHRIAIDMIQSEKLGKPLVVRVYQKTPPYWGDMTLDKIVQDFMLHNFDFLNEIIGEPNEVIATGIERENSHAFVHLKYEEAIASVESSTLLPEKFSFTIGFHIICELGTLTFDGRFGEITEQKMMLYDNDTIETIPLPSNDDYEEAIKYMLDAINNGNDSSMLSIKESIKSLKVALAVKESLRINNIVTLKNKI